MHGPGPSPRTDTAPAIYTTVISPIFEAHCHECYGATMYQTPGGGNNSNYVGIERQSISLILGCIHHDPGFDHMPRSKTQLSACDIARIQA